MKKLTRVKIADAERRCTLEGIKVAEVVGDTDIKSITLEDKKGKQLKISYGSYDVAVYGSKEPEYENKWVLRGNYKGIQVNEVFDEKYEASKRHGELDYDVSLVIGEEMVEA